MFLSEMLSPSVAKLNPADVLVVGAIGALEQHSNHMPLGTDHLLGDAVVARLEAAMPDKLLCLPTVWAGCSSHHLGFAGTISLSTNTMGRIITDVVGSLERSGFRRFLLINSHGGNRAVMACTIQEMGTHYPDMTVVGVSYWDPARDALMTARETELGGMGHACELETSLMLADRPGLVEMSRAEPDGIISDSRFTQGEMLSPSMVAIYKPVSRTSHHGGYGDPMSASREKGELFFDIINRNLIDLCEDMLRDRL
jgi:creatinine amidohydrolase